MTIQKNEQTSASIASILDGTNLPRQSELCCSKAPSHLPQTQN